MAPVFSFGLIADVQWADRDDGFNFAHTLRRCYRGALAQLKEAVAWWSASELAFVVNLGDLADGTNAVSHQSETAFGIATSLLRSTPHPVVHLLGNHVSDLHFVGHLPGVVPVAHVSVSHPCSLPVCASRAGSVQLSALGARRAATAARCCPQQDH